MACKAVADPLFASIAPGPAGLFGRDGARRLGSVAECSPTDMLPEAMRAIW